MRRDFEGTEIRRQGDGRVDPTSHIRPGDALAGRFILNELLGHGGSGTVWSALDTRVGDRVAVKILDVSRHDPANRERLRREIRATRSGHPNVVSIHELHEEKNSLFITMELVDGLNLREALADRGRLSLDDVASIGRQIADALDHLHSQGLVHRDVKPGNIMLASEGVAKLCDMGLARPLAAGATVTESQMVVGTPTYMAPEMAREGELVAASDVYALGLTLYQCLVEEVPLARSTAVDTLMARQQSRARPVRTLRPECPRWLNRLLDRMLDPAPELRPTAAEVGRALEQQGFGWRPRRRQLRVAGWLLVATVLGTAAVTFAVNRWGTPLDPAKDPAANNLLVSVEGFDSGAVYSITDGHRRSVLSLSTDQRWNHEKNRLNKTRHVVFSDLDGDGRQDVVFANPDGLISEQIEIHKRLPDGSTELADAWNLHHEWEYEGQSFNGFAPEDVECADLDGDGVPEIILAYRSSPYYLAEVLVFRPDGEEVLRVYHPGQIGNIRVGDRDRDGRAEVYVGATNNFHGQNHGNSSSPAFFTVEANWSISGQVLNLFGPGRTMTGRVPKGIEVHYLSFVNQTVVPPLTPWRYALVTRVSAVEGDRYVMVHTDRTKWVKTEKLSFLRFFGFDRGLEVLDAIWVVGPLEERGIAPATTDLEQFEVTYWNGVSWQPEVCSIPQAD